MAVARFSQETGWDTLGGVVEGDEVLVQTERFSDFMVVLKKVGQRIVDSIIKGTDWIVLHSGLVLKRVQPPTCAGGSTFTKWTVLPADLDTDGQNRLRWCTEATNDDRQLVVRVRNNRPYAQVLTLPGVPAIGAYSDDLWTHTISNVLSATQPQGRKLWVASGKQLDVTFEQPSSGPATQRIQITPFPDVSGTLVRLVAEESHTTVDRVSSLYDCYTDGRNLDRLRDKGPIDVFPAAVEVVESCSSAFSETAEWLVLAKKAVTRVPDWVTDRRNRLPQIDYVVNTRAERTTTTTTTTSSPRPPQITATSTYTEALLVYARVSYRNGDAAAVGFGFRGARGAGWAPESHPFSNPSYGRVSVGRVDYPFNLGCGSANQYESDVEFWLYDSTGLRSASTIIHLKC